MEMFLFDSSLNSKKHYFLTDNWRGRKTAVDLDEGKAVSQWQPFQRQWYMSKSFWVFVEFFEEERGGVVGGKGLGKLQWSRVDLKSLFIKKRDIEEIGTKVK